jgi:hypothetical protein
MIAQLRAFAGLAAGIIAVLAFLPYCVSILKGRTKPSWVSWSIWTVVGFTTLVTYRSVGATSTLWLAGAYVLNPVLVAILAIKYGTRGAGRLDWVCLGGTLLCLLVWAFARAASAALFFNIAIDALGALPTLRKAYDAPETEDSLAWSLAFAASAINLGAVDTWALRISAYPLYSLACMGLIAGTLFWRGRRRRALASSANPVQVTL